MTQLMTDEGQTVRVPAGTWNVDPAHSSVAFEVKHMMISTVRGHFRSPDFFDAHRYPEIRFESTRVAHVEGGTYNGWGDLTIKDVTREVQMTATVEGAGRDPWGTERVGIAIRGEIDRTDFGLRRQQKLATGGLLVGENVKVLADVSAVRA
jgi:polyisoprenoid-binding protein YceI